MNVIDLSLRRRGADMPLFMMVDLQVEYISEGRAYYIEDHKSCLENCRKLIRFAREWQLPVAHFRQLEQSQFFNRATSFADWIEGFKPRPNEMVFEREQHSCYSNISFRNLLDQVLRPNLIVAGFSGGLSCLATAVDAYHLGHNMVFVGDASASLAVGARSCGDSHAFTKDIVGGFVPVVSTEQILSHFQQSRPILTGTLP